MFLLLLEARKKDRNRNAHPSELYESRKLAKASWVLKDNSQWLMTYPVQSIPYTTVRCQQGTSGAVKLGSFGTNSCWCVVICAGWKARRVFGSAPRIIYPSISSSIKSSLAPSISCVITKAKPNVSIAVAFKIFAFAVKFLPGRRQYQVRQALLSLSSYKPSLSPSTSFSVNIIISVVKPDIIGQDVAPVFLVLVLLRHRVRFLFRHRQNLHRHPPPVKLKCIQCGHGREKMV